MTLNYRSLFILMWLLLPALFINNQVLHADPGIRRIRVVLDSNYPPFSFKSGTGAQQGVQIDQWRLWEKKTGIKAELVLLDWGEAMNGMKRGEFDVIDSIFENEERKAWLDFTAPYTTIEVAIFFQKEISGITDAESLKGFQVAVKRGDDAVERLRRNSIDSLLLFENFESIIIAAKERKVSVFVMDTPPAIYFLNRHGIQDRFNKSMPINTARLHRAVKKEDAWLLNEIENGFAKISPKEFESIETRWYGSSVGTVKIPLYIFAILAGIGFILLVLSAWNRLLHKTVAARTAELKTSLESLKKLSIHQDAIMAAIPDILVEVDNDNIYRWVNTAGKDFFGEDVTGKRAEYYMDEPADARDGMVTISRDNIILTYCENRQRRKDGEMRLLAWWRRELKNLDGTLSGAVSTARDITELKKSEMELRLAEEKYRSIFNNSSEGIFQTTIEGNLVIANPAFIRIFGYDSLEDLKIHTSNLISNLCLFPEKREELKRRLIVQGHVEDFEFSACQKDKTVIEISMNSHVIRDNNGHIVFFEGTLTDVTAKKKVKELKIAKEAAETETKAKSEFLANMSHEIRTPMNAILGFSQILKEQLKDEKYQRYLNAIFSSGNILINLINDILDLSKIEAGRLLLEYRPVSPRDIFNEIASIFRDEIEEKGLELKVEIDPDIPEALLLDEIRLRQILFNLVGNAVKFTDNGFIKISLNKHAVGGEGSRIDLYFSVIDTGIGIPGDQQDEMFEIFTQQKGQSAKKYGGSGLGLSICKRLVSMMGGDIWMESEEGVGTAFYVVLKNLSTATSIPSGQESPSRTEYVRFNGGKVLIADDIKNNRDLLNEYFTPLGLEIIEAENGEIAVEKARSEKPGFILMDIKMPVMDGYEAARILKSDPETGSVPVFACTASVFLCDTAEFREAGFDGYMLKPLSMISVIEILKKYFKYTVDAEAGPNGKKNDFKEGLSYGGSPEELKNLLDRLEGDNLDRWKKISATYIIKEIKFFAEDIIRLGDEFNAGFLKDWGAVVSINASHFDMENLVNSFNKYPLLLNEVKKLHENF